MGLKALMPIKKGDQIFTRYTTPQLGTIRRQHLLQSQWYFSCDCRRCSDPTECGSMANALKCQKCPPGVVLPENPRRVDSDWKCLECSHTVDPSQALGVIMGIEKAVNSVNERVSSKPFWPEEGQGPS